MTPAVTEPESTEPPPDYAPFDSDPSEWTDVGSSECPYDRETKILKHILWEDRQDEQRQS